MFDNNEHRAKLSQILYGVTRILDEYAIYRPDATAYLFVKLLETMSNLDLETMSNLKHMASYKVDTSKYIKT